jgi:hypothetical protein
METTEKDEVLYRALASYNAISPILDHFLASDTPDPKKWLPVLNAALSLLKTFEKDLSYVVNELREEALEE